MTADPIAPFVDQPPIVEPSRNGGRPTKRWLEDVSYRRDSEWVRLPGLYDASALTHYRREFVFSLDFQTAKPEDPENHPHYKRRVWVRRKPAHLAGERTGAPPITLTKVEDQ